MEGSLVLWAVALSLVLFLALAASFLGGMTLGMRIGSGGTRSLLGAMKGSSFQAPDPEYAYPDGEVSAREAMAKAFGNGWAEDGGKVLSPEARQAAQDYDSAMKAVDRQVKRFLDSTVSGTGPRRARFGEADDDE